MAVLLLILFLACILACWLATLTGLPGNWAMLVAAACYDWWLPDAWHWPLGWQVLAILLVMAVLGELVELFTGFWQSRRVGGSRLSAVLSLIGSIVGGFAGALVAIPVPLIGSVIAALLGSILGALLGGIAGEFWIAGRLRQSLVVGSAAAMGRLLGTLGKSLIGGVMVAVLLIALVAGNFGTNSREKDADVVTAIENAPLRPAAC